MREDEAVGQWLQLMKRFEGNCLCFSLISLHNTNDFRLKRLLKVLGFAVFRHYKLAKNKKGAPLSPNLY